MFRGVEPLNKHELAWAAGFFDAEGSFTFVRFDRRRDRRRARASLPQAGDEYPETLIRFQNAVGGQGRRLERPARGYFYYWYSEKFETVQAVGAMLWPWLGSEKRDQFRRVMSLATKSAKTLARASAPVETAQDLAWAAGLFDGEGTFAGSPSTPPDRYRTISARLPQSSAAGVPEVLSRLQRVLRCGQIRGPRIQSSPWSKLPQYRWEVTNPSDVNYAVDAMWPYLGVHKRAQARLALERYASTPPQRIRTVTRRADA